MAKVKLSNGAVGVRITSSAERLGHIKSGLKQTGTTKVVMWGPLKGSAAQKFSQKMKRTARGW